MIEVEKKFLLDGVDMDRFLDGAEFVKEVTNHDVYWDYPDYRLALKNIVLRNRNGNFELKIIHKRGISDEIDSEQEIKKYFDLSVEIGEFVKDNLIPIIQFNTIRKKYRKDGFIIDIDQADFGHKVCEVELLVEKKEEIKEAEEKILNFALPYGFDPSKNAGKRQAYLKKFNPELYKKLYEEKESKI